MVENIGPNGMEAEEKIWLERSVKRKKQDKEITHSSNFLSSTISFSHTHPNRMLPISCHSIKCSVIQTLLMGKAIFPSTYKMCQSLLDLLLLLGRRPTVRDSFMMTTTTGVRSASQDLSLTNESLLQVPSCASSNTLDNA